MLTNDIMNLLLLLITMGVTAFCVACLALAFYAFQTPGMIFNGYGRWLIEVENGRGIIQLFSRKYNIIRIPKWLAKPLGLCPYCNGTWIAIVVFLYLFQFSLLIFLFIGLNWFFIHLVKTKLNVN